jgi:hypothetical protein
LILAWRLCYFLCGCAIFLRSGMFSFQWVRASAPVGCSPQGPKGVVDSFWGLILYCCWCDGCNLTSGRPVGTSSEFSVVWFARATSKPLRGAKGRSRGTLNFLVYTPLCRLSVRRKRGKAPCHPRWATSMVFPLSCCWVIRVGV